MGYFVGKFYGGKEAKFCLAFGSLYVLWCLANDLKLKSEGKYQEIYIPPLFVDINHDTNN